MAELQLSILMVVGGRADDFRRVIRQWSSTGLLGPIAFVGGNIDDSSQVRDIEVEVLAFPSKDGTPSVPRLARLDQALGPDFKLVRLVVVQLVDGQEQPPVFVAGTRLRALLTKHLGPVTKVHLNMIIPSSDVEQTSPLAVSQNVFPGWNANLIVSPEDRVTPVATDRSVPADSLAGHAALATSVAAALWVGVDIGPFDRAPENQTPEVRLVRTFAGVIDGDPVIDFLADNVLLLSRIGDGDAWPEPAMAGTLQRLPQVPRDQVPGRMVALADHAMGLGGGVLRFTDLAPPVPPGTEPITFRQAFRWYVDFVLGRALSMPGEYGRAAGQEMRRRIEDIVTSKMFGKDSAVTVTFGGRPRPGEPPPFSFDYQQDLLQQAQQVLGDIPDPPFYPQLWADLRDAAFGLVDGSGLPAAWPWRGLQGETPVVTWPGEIVPPPSSRLTIGVAQLRTLGLGGDQPVTIGACDALTAFRFVNLLRSRTPGAPGGAPAPTPPYRTPAYQPPAHQPPTAAPAAATPPPFVPTAAGPPAYSGFDDDLDDGGTEPAIWIGEAQPVEPAVLDLSSNTVEWKMPETDAAPPDDDTSEVDWNEAADGSVEGLEQSLLSWARERSTSFLYGVAHRCGAEISAAEAAMFAALELLGNPPTDPKPLKRDRSVRALFIAGVIGLLLLIWAGKSEWLGLSLLLGCILGVVWLIVAVVAGMFRAYSRINRHFRELHRRPPAQKMQQWALDRLRNSVNELARLQSQYQVLMEWGEIIGHLIHEPFVRPNGDLVDDPFRRLDDTPDALTMLRAGRTPERSIALTNRMRNGVFEQHWMTGMYHRVEDDVLEEFRLDLGREVRPKPPAEDNGIRSTNSRTFLVRQLESGKVGRSAWTKMVDQLTVRATELGLNALFDDFSHEGSRTAETAWGRDVRSIEEFLGGLAPERAMLAMSTAVLAEEGMIAVGGRVSGVYLALPDRVDATGDWPPELVMRVPAPSRMMAGGDFWTLGLRADVSESFAPGMSSLFRYEAYQHKQVRNPAVHDTDTL